MTNPIQYESNEELWVSYYLKELQSAGFISDWEYQPKTYILSEPLRYSWIKKLATKTTKQISKLMQGHEYTPDFMIVWEEKARNLFFNTVDNKINLKNAIFIAHSGNNMSIIDVKPAFDMQNMTRLFTINQKWMMDKYGLYVQKIVPVKETKHYHKVGNKNKKVYSHSTWSGIFPKTFTPERYFLTDVSGKPRKINYTPIRLNEYLKSKQNTGVL
uniref:Uncharacterized protein n=1 Tax=viral metagenome TaxID=1070528 RepID=A0A6M3IYA4_9ZZZZ